MKKSLFTITFCLIAGVVAWLFLKPKSTSINATEITLPALQKSDRSGIASKEYSHFHSLSDSATRYEVKVDMLRQLDHTSLTEHDIDTLYNQLDFTPEAARAEEWYVIVNEIMEQLRHDSLPSDRYANALLQITQNADVPSVVRDYAVQHLSLAINPLEGKDRISYLNDPTQVQNILSTFAELVTDPTLGNTSVPGTTVMVMADLKHSGLTTTHFSLALDTLKPFFLSALSGEQHISKLTRISTLNAIGGLGLTEYAPMIRSLALAENTPNDIRLNSIAALGQLGTEEDHPALQRIADSDSRLRYAAKSALKNLAHKYSR